MMPFERRPAATGAACEFVLDVGGTALSGLIAEPAGGRDPRAVIVALHGAGMHAGYFHATTAPGLSLLELGSSLGYTVWAPDRPGVGTSADLPDEVVTLLPQAELLLDAVQRFAAARPVGAGVFLVGHSYGLRVAWTMAAAPRGEDLLGLDGAGSGLRYAFTRGAYDDHNAAADTDRGRPWGPEALYPPGTFDAQSLPVHRMRAAQVAEGPRWAEDFAAMAPRLRLPMRLTFGAHERFWRTDPEALAELTAALSHGSNLRIEIEPDAGHNISLGWSARSYHLKVAAFLEACIVRRQLADANPGANIVAPCD